MTSEERIEAALDTLADLCKAERSPTDWDGERRLAAEAILYHYREVPRTRRMPTVTV